jgi:hypothetical protein
MEIISTRKVGKRVSPSREFTEYIGNETRNDFAGQNRAGNGFAGQNRARNGFASQNGGREWLHCWYRTSFRVGLTALRVVIASHMGTASHIGITS